MKMSSLVKPECTHGSRMFYSYSLAAYVLKYITADTQRTFVDVAKEVSQGHYKRILTGNSLLAVYDRNSQ